MERANAGSHVGPLFRSSADARRESFVRIINRSLEGSEVQIVATDDSGWRPGELTIAIPAGEAVHFNSADLEQGNAEKGLAGSAGAPVEGNWRLELVSHLNLEVLSYVRTRDRMLSSGLDTVPGHESSYRVAMFIPGGSVNGTSRLRQANPGEEDAEVTVRGIDDSGMSPGGMFD